MTLTVDDAPTQSPRHKDRDVPDIQQDMDLSYTCPIEIESCFSEQLHVRLPENTTLKGVSDLFSEDKQQDVSGKTAG